MTENIKQQDPILEKEMPEKSEALAKPKTTQKMSKKGSRIWLKDILLGIINVVFIFGLIFLLNKLPQKAEKAKALRSASQLITFRDTTELQKFELDSNTENIQKLIALFASEDTLLTFVEDVEKLKETGTVTGFTFASAVPVADNTKNLGLPIIIEFSGTWDAINADIKTIQSLPILFRPVTFDAEEVPEESVVNLKYGGFLYVDESFEKN